jgi:hypothetical protein
MPLSPEQMGAIRNMLDQQAKQQAAQQQQQQTYPIISEEIDRYIQQRRGSPELHPYESPALVYEPKDGTWWDSVREWIGLIFQLLVWAFIALGILLVICPFR